MVVVEVLGGLVGRHDDLVGVDNDDVIAGVDVGCEERAVLAAQQGGGHRRHATEHEALRVNEIIAATPLSAPPAQRDAWWGDWDVPDLRFIVLHVIAETACHAGHLDAARELIDGRQYVVLGEA